MFKTSFLAAAVSAALAPAAFGVVIVGVTDDNTVVTFDSADPANLLSGVAVSGLASNEFIEGIDFRPTTGDLYAVGSFGNVYTLNQTTGAATLQFNIGVLDGSSFGVDFNPAADFGGASSLRVVSNTNQNLAVNVDTGIATVATDVFNPNGATPNIVGEAYTNAVPGGIPGGVGGPPGTVQYAIDSGSDTLSIQAFNAGTLTLVGGLGVDSNAELGFDIWANGIGNNIGYATIVPTGGSVSHLYEINLTTGIATDLGQINGGIVVPNISATPIPEPGSAALLALGLLAMRRRRHA